MAQLMRPCASPGPMPRSPDQTALFVARDRAQLAEFAAGRFVAAAEKAVSSRGRFLVLLSGGSTPQALFSLLAGDSYRKRIDWTAVHVCWGDERLVPPDDAGSNYHHARRLLFDHVAIPAAQVVRVRGELPAADAVKDYEQRLAQLSGGDRSWPRFDLALMGLGHDGHTASLFPGSDATSETSRPVLAVTAVYENRPAQRITLTPPVFNDAREILFLVAGADKAEALAAVIQGPYDIQRWPAQAVQPVAGGLIWLVDAEAARLLRSRETD
jgi:6-phosphogluconolactonase